MTHQLIIDEGDEGLFQCEPCDCEMTIDHCCPVVDRGTMSTPTYQVGDHLIATDASGQDHAVTVAKEPWRGHSMAVIGLTFDDLPAHQHTCMVWPLNAVRPAEAHQ